MPGSENVTDFDFHLRDGDISMMKQKHFILGTKDVYKIPQGKSSLTECTTSLGG